MAFKKVRRFFRWIFGAIPDIVNDPDCPTCGPKLYDYCGGEADFECSEIEQHAKTLEDRYDFIFTNNKYKAIIKPPVEMCEEPIKQKYVLIRTSNRCNKVGAIRKSGGGVEVCLECEECATGGCTDCIGGGGCPGGSCPDDGPGGETDSKNPQRSAQALADDCPSGGCGGSGGTGETEGTSKRIILDSLPNGKCMYDNTCPDANCAYWFYVNESRMVTPAPDVNVKKRTNRNRSAQISAQRSSDVVTPMEGTPCQPELIYDDSGCKVIGIKPVLLARGKLAYWESTQVYPLTEKCDGSPLYGEDAGTPIRHHKMPNRALEPHYLSRQTGVVSYMDPGNKEWGNTYARFIQVEINNVRLPEKTAKPLNEHNPFTLMMMPRTDANKSVRASGLFINTFKGNIHGEEFVIPKNGVNSLEYFDANIYYGGNDHHRGGENIDTFSMVFHGPDTQFDRPALDADTIKLELNMFGKGVQHGSCASGEVPDSKYVSRENQRGVRAAVNLSAFVTAGPDKKGVNKCVKGISYADEHSVVDKGDDFTYPLLNLYRESSVYVEAKGPPYRLRRTLVTNNSTPNNGHPGRPTGYDGTSDYSFLGSHLWHERPIHDASAFYGNLKTYLPDQYGGLVNATYIDLYPLSGEEIRQGVEGSARASIGINAGDSFIGIHHIVRKSFVSDKMMEDISPPLYGGGAEDFEVLGTILRKLFENLGLEECGTCPDNGDYEDPRNGAGVEVMRDSFTGAPWDGIGPPPAATGSDIFFPHVQKTQISYVTESDVNLYYRATGDPDAGEVHYPKLKGLNLDSNFPKDSDWKKGYLNRFYVKMNENPRWKMIFRVLANLLFTYSIGLYMIIDGMSALVQTISTINISFMNLNIGGLAGSLIEIGVVALGIAWIVYWANTDKDNKFWDKLLGVDGCWPDITAKENVTGSRFMTRPGRVLQFENNYYKYNFDYSKTNLASATLGLPDPYSTCECPTERSYEILYSNKQNPMSPTDAYRNFKVNSYIEIPSNTGKMQKIFRLANRVFVQTSDAMYSLQTGASQMKTGDDRSVYLEAATTLQVPVEIFGGTKEGRGGTLDPNACIVTKWGYINVDVEAREIGLFTGSNYQLLGDFGMTKFLDNFIPYQATDRIRDEKIDGGIGFSIGIDNGKSLIHITKRDYDADGRDLHWTLTFDMENMSWVGFEYFTPIIYAWDRFKAFSFYKNELWRHNKVGEFLTVYGQPVPMIVDFVIKDRETLDAFAWRHSAIDAEFDQWQDVGYVAQNELFFKEIGAHNSYQSSGLMPVIHQNDLDAISKSNQDPSVLPVSSIHRKWRFNSLIDKVEVTGMRLFTTWREDIFTDFNDAVLGQGTQNDRFIDNYMVMRLVFDGHNDVRVLLKNVMTEANSEIL